MIGKILGGRYEIIEQIGGGGMALVYKAKCQLLNRLVAVKVLRNEFAKDEEFVQKFRRESQAAASLSHPNIVNIYDVGVDMQEGQPIHYIVMEYVNGGTLKDLIREKGKLSVEDTVEYTKQIASALKDAHKNNIIHRDIKPQNIMITEDNRVKVTDFGIARAATNATVTATSDVLGSVHYFSPEQARGGYTDAKSDIYSLGIVMYEMATGILPYQGDSAITVALKHVQDDIVPPIDINPNIPENLNYIILKCVEKKQIDRYQNINELLKDLNYVYGQPLNYNKMEDDSHTRIIPKAELEEELNASMRKEEQVRKPKKKKQKRNDGGFRGVILGVLFAFLLTTGIFIGMQKFKSGSGKEVIVPSVIGKTEEEARSIITDAKLQFIVKGTVKNDRYDPGVVVSQSVRENTKVKENFPIEVEINQSDDKEDEELVSVPNVVNKSMIDAEKILRMEGFKIKVDYKESDEVEQDYVIEQDLEAFTEVTKGSEINLVVSRGKDKKTITMPKLVDMKEADAKAKLKSLGLESEVVRQTDENKEKGIVTWQSYEPGSEIETGTTVEIYVSLGQPEEKEEKPKEEAKDDKVKEEKGTPFTFIVTPKQDQEFTNIKVVRIQDGVSEIVYNKKHNVSDGDVSITIKDSKKGSKFEIFFDDEHGDTLTKMD